MLGAILTHRGIDVPLGGSPSGYAGESTWEAFSAQVRAGHGLEFDIQPMLGGGFAVCHDLYLGRMTGGVLNNSFSDITRDELRAVNLTVGRLCELDELLVFLAEQGKTVSALHLKRHCQRDEILDLLADQLRPFLARLGGRLVLFDVVPSAAKHLKAALPDIDIAASVAHSFDVQRYGSLVGGTLMTIDDVVDNRELYSWVWLDEWDRIGPCGKYKTLVDAITVEHLRGYGFMIAAVSPELHATSPALLGGEAHEVGADPARLQACWEEWTSLGLDALCTDHASWLTKHMSQSFGNR